MRNSFPCPNPTCAQVFAPNAVRGAASLVCPRCGTTFQFRPQAAAPPPPPAHPVAPPPPKPAGQPPPRAKAPRESPAAPAKAPPPLPGKAPSRAAVKVAPPPLAAPVVKAPPPLAPPVAEPAFASVPIARPVEEARPSALAFNTEPDLLLSPRHRRARPRRGFGRWVFLGLLLLVCVGALAAGSYFILRYFKPVTDQATQSKQANFHFKRPGKEWKIDRGVESRMALQIALTRLEPRCHVALFYRDYKNRSPSEAELLDEALKKLRIYFKQVDYEDPFLSDKKAPSGTLGGKPALVVEFQGTDPETVVMRGQCHALTWRGYAYWFFAWGPADNREVLDESWVALRDHFQLLNGRDGWKEAPREKFPFQGTALAYQLDFAKDLWKKESEPKDYDDRAELLLRGFEPTLDEETGKKAVVAYAGRAAEVVVLVLPAAPKLEDANKNAIQHLLLHKKEKEKLETASIALAKDPRTDKVLLDRDTNVGGFRGHLSKLRIENDRDNVRFGYLGVVNRPDGALVIFCECADERKDFWDREFQVLMESVRPRSGDGPARPPKKGRPPKKEPLDKEKPKKAE